MTDTNDYPDVIPPHLATSKLEFNNLDELLTVLATETENGLEAKKEKSK